MEVARSIQEARVGVAAARRTGRPVGLVPTMGALHAAHMSLVDASRTRGDFTVVSIFVNPTQFGPNEDYAQYPRDEQRDLDTCEKAGVPLVFAPSVIEMYPEFPQRGSTTISVAGVTDHLCGPQRPGHFAGVATVVAKLLHIVAPHRAYFGKKDYQQLAVIRRMVRDLNLPAEIIGCETLREPDGLALSSRNAYLSAAEREQATSLYAALRAAETAIRAGERDPSAVETLLRQRILAAGPASIDYASVVDDETLTPVTRIERPVTLALAVRIGHTRLIDNLQVDPPTGDA